MSLIRRSSMNLNKMLYAYFGLLNLLPVGLRAWKANFESDFEWPPLTAHLTEVFCHNLPATHFPDQLKLGGMVEELVLDIKQFDQGNWAAYAN